MPNAGYVGSIDQFLATSATSSARNVIRTALSPSVAKHPSVALSQVPLPIAVTIASSRRTTGSAAVGAIVSRWFNSRKTADPNVPSAPSLN